MTLLLGLLGYKQNPETLGLKQSPTTLVPVPVVEIAQTDYDTNPAPQVGGGSVTATLNVVEADDIISSTTAVLVTATLSVTEANDALSSASTVLVTAASALTEAGDQPAIAVVVTITASVAELEANDSVAGSSHVLVSASAPMLEANDSVAGSSHVLVSASAAELEANDVLSAATGLGPLGNITADFEVTEEGDTLLAATVLPSIRLPRLAYRITARTYLFSGNAGAARVRMSGEIIVPLLFDGRGKAGTPQIILTTPGGNVVAFPSRAIVSLGTAAIRDRFPGSYLRVIALEDLLTQAGVYKIQGQIGIWYSPEMFFKAA